MNLPAQSICFPSDAASCLPIVTRSILSPSMTTVAFGRTLPSAGLITVPPTREIFSARAVSTKLDNAIPVRISALLIMRMESNLASWRFSWRHQLTNRVEYEFKLRIILLLERTEFTCEIGIRKQHFAQPHKRAHDRDVHLHRALASYYARQHCHTLLSEGVW